MAKIIYYDSLDSGKAKRLETNSMSIGDCLKFFGIENLQLSVSINGETPDECDLNYVLSETDTLEIRRPLEGGNSRTKSDIGTIVQIAALVAASFATGGVALSIILAGQVVAGVFQKWSMDLAPKPTGADISDVDTSSNSYSLATASNEVRPLRAMPLLMGGHRMAPDIYGQAFKSVYNEQNTLAPSTPYLDTYIPGQTGSNGAMAVNNNWATMPAGYIIPGAFPIYPIKIAPYWWNLPPGPISPADNQMVIDDVKNRYLSGDYLMKPSQIGSATYMPLVIYHTAADAPPIQNRYNFFFMIARHYDVMGYAPTQYGLDIDAIFDNTGSNALYFFFSSTGPVVFPKDIIATSGGFYYPSTVVGGDNFAAVQAKYSTLLSSLNGGNLVNPKTDSYAVQVQYGKIGLTTVIKEGIPYSSQAFNFGIGDLAVSQRLIGAFDVDATGPFSNLAVYGQINKTPGFFQWKWWPSMQGPDGNNTIAFDEVLPIENKSLKNQAEPSVVIPLTDLNQYNFAYFEGKKGMDSFGCTVAGHLYSTNTSTGFSANSCDIEIQWRFKEEPMWRSLPITLTFPFLPGQILTISNNNTKKITYKIGFNTNQVSGETRPDSIIQVRIRKMTLDSVNNENANICNINLEDGKFYRSIDFADRIEHRKALNLESLVITANVTDVAQSNKYTAFAESKCWVYDFDTDTWSWDFNRNPAYWFLYFARGGFLNDTADGTLLPPYSPTTGWLNYPGHPDNRDLMFGVGLTNDRIDLDKVLEWAQFCEDNELYFDLVLKDETSSADVLERIANAGRGSVTYVSGNLSVIYEDPEQAPTCLFGMGNILAGSFAVDYLVSDAVTKVVGKYIDSTDWESKEVSAIVPFADDEYDKVIEINLEGIIDTDRAQREVNLLAARQFYQRRTYSWSADSEGMLAKRGDLVYLGHDATQYGFSGRIIKYNLVGGLIESIETTANLDSSSTYVTIRSPDGSLDVYPCSCSGKTITFLTSYPLSLAPFYVNDTVENLSSAFPNSIAEDFVFIAGSKATPGKLVRISESIPDENGNYAFKAIDEDPAMWAWEFENVVPPESFDDSEVVLSLKNIKTETFENGLVKVSWENVNGDFIQIINVDTGLPIEANGSYSFTGGEVTIELMPNEKYLLEIKPFSIGTPFKSVSKKVVVWSK